MNQMIKPCVTLWYRINSPSLKTRIGKGLESLKKQVNKYDLINTIEDQTKGLFKYIVIKYPKKYGHHATKSKFENYHFHNMLYGYKWV